VAERKHTVVCIFDPNSPRISAFEIHEWLYEQSHVSENSLTMIQIVGIRRHVYLKFVDDTYVTDLLQIKKVRMEYRHSTWEILIVRLVLQEWGHAESELQTCHQKHQNAL
jgi:hypothetical protein